MGWRQKKDSWKIIRGVGEALTSNNVTGSCHYCIVDGILEHQAADLCSCGFEVEMLIDLTVSLFPPLCVGIVAFIV